MAMHFNAAAEPSSPGLCQTDQAVTVRPCEVLPTQNPYSAYAALEYHPPLEPRENFGRHVLTQGSCRRSSSASNRAGDLKRKPKR
jgi:hypothetical protein